MENNYSQLVQDGFTIVDTSFLNAELDLIKTSFYQINSSVSAKKYNSEISNDSDLINFHKIDQNQQFNLWKVFQFSPLLYKIAGNSELMNLLNLMGITLPSLDLGPQLRCDMPIENQSVFLRHQDYTYNIGSNDSVTVWTPLQNTSVKEGCLLCVPKSHKMGIFSHLNGIIDESLSFDFIPVEVKYGQSLIFNQKLVHQSGVNTSDKIRFSIQLRFSNLHCSEYLERNYYKNHKSISTKFA